VTAPAWLTEPEVGLCPCGCIGRRTRRGFVDKTLRGGAGVLRTALFSDEVSARPGLLQRIDPRVKLATVVALLVACGLVHRLAVLLAAYAATVVLAVASRVPMGLFLRRVWLFVPLFTGVVVLPATLNVITDGDVVVGLGTWFGHDLGITRQGLQAAALIVVRVATSISLVVLLVLTTSWTRLLASLRSLGVPRVFVLVLGMAYRYVFHLLGAVTDMYEARTARTPRPDTDVTRGRAFVTASAGALFGKAHTLAEEVHLAMVARGYRGSPRSLAPGRLRALDGVWALASVLAVVAILGADHALRG
jgi:cobalt ECF transporter T component CbiQ